MGKRVKRARRRMGVIVAEDVTFATMIHQSDMHVRVQQGVVLLQDDQTGKPYLLPPGLVLSAAAKDEPCSAYIRDMTNEVLMERGVNDILEDELSLPKNEDVMPVDNWDEVLTLMDEIKLKKVTSTLLQLVNIIGGLLLCGVAVWLSQTEFFLTYAVYAAAFLGFGVFAWGLYRAVQEGSCVNSKVISDKHGKYINLDSGKSNLNGGMKIPMSQG